MPELADIRKLRLGILQFVIVQPILAFIELFLSWEAMKQVHFEGVFEGRKPYMAVVKICSNLTAMSSCAGLALLCEMADPNDEVEAGALIGKRSYVQRFLWGLNLIPAVLHGFLEYFLEDITLANGTILDPRAQANLSTAAVVCLGSAFVARGAAQAFKVDDPTLYPHHDLKEPLI
eukprot:TRINITY_DN21831_c0_g1_i2.p1 TRINITY_DN21831_c0_g1~~TRINITY_DN21831_c0_g1_i2.p1  ORF type:complete len:176 (+),score=28.87 TRINITY_DN21831_c0_g1_i2:269-796(+)